MNVDSLAEDEWRWLPGVVRRANGAMIDALVACHRALPTASRSAGVRSLDGQVLQLGHGDCVGVRYSDADLT